MHINKDGIDLIKSFEGVRLIAYDDMNPDNPITDRNKVKGTLTIGYGHTAGVYVGQVISMAQAENMLKSDLVKYEKYVTDTVKIPLNEYQFSALVSFCYNCGVGNLKKLVDNRNASQIADAILLYNKAGGKVLDGLKRRREAERKLFLHESYTEPVKTYSKAKDGNANVSKNFKVKEFACKDNSDAILIDTKFVTEKLQKIRDHFGVPITINSAYRTETYNAKVGGAKNSYHMKGRAFDIVVKGKDLDEVARYAQTIGILGIIRYNTFIHVDSRETKYLARNNNGKVTNVTTF